jgi:hypothetical protein
VLASSAQRDLVPSERGQVSLSGSRVFDEQRLSRSWDEFVADRVLDALVARVGTDNMSAVARTYRIAECPPVHSSRSEGRSKHLGHKSTRVPDCGDEHKGPSMATPNH